MQARLVRRVGNVQTIATDKHARPNHLSTVDEVAHGDVHVLIRAQIANRRHACFQRAQRSLARKKNFDGGRIRRELLEHRLTRGFVGVYGHVRVDVNESRQARVLREINHLCSGRNRSRVVCHRFNVVALHDDYGVCPQPAFRIPKLAETHGLDWF